MTPNGEHERLWPGEGRLIDISWYGRPGEPFETLGETIGAAGCAWQLWRDQDTLGCWGVLSAAEGPEARILVERMSAGEVLEALAELATRRAEVRA